MKKSTSLLAILRAGVNETVGNSQQTVANNATRRGKVHPRRYIRLQTATASIGGVLPLLTSSQPSSTCERSMRRAHRLSLLALVMIGCHASCALAEDGCTGPSTDCVAVGHWNFSVALGAGVRTNPLVHGTDIPLVVIPQFSYYGKRVFIENLDVGVTLVEGDTQTFSLVASPGYDRVFFYRSDLQNIFLGGLPGSSASPGGASASPGGANASTPGSPAQKPEAFPSRPRQVTYLAGPEWTFKSGGVSAQVDFLHEITGRNHGDEVRAALAVPMTRARNPVTVTVGLTWKSAAIVNYYYGAPNIYEGGSAVNPFVKLGYTRRLTPHWRLTALAQYEYLDKAIADSPIVAQHYVATVFAGATYEF